MWWYPWGMPTTIPILNRQGRTIATFTVDDADAPYAHRFTWRLVCGYPARTEYDPAYPEKRRTVYFHRELLGAPRGLEVDHLDADRLNCQRANLEIVTKQLNLHRMLKRHNFHAGKPKNRPLSTRPGAGVFFESTRGRWRARLGRKFLGWFPTQEAATAARAAALARIT